MTDAPRGRRRRRWLVAAVVLVLAGAATPIVLRRLEWRAYDREVARLASAGLPTSQTDLEQGVGPAALARGDEIVAAIESLVEALFVPSGSAWTAPGPWNLEAPKDWPQGESPERIAECRAFLDQARPYVARVRAAIAEGPVAFREGPHAEVKGLRRLPDAIRLLDATAAVADADAERIDAIETLVRMGHAVEGPGWVELALAWHGARTGARRALEDAASGRTPAAELRSRLDRWPEPRAVPVLRFVGRSAVAFAVERIDAWRRGETERPFRVSVRRGAAPTLWDRVRAWWRVGGRSSGQDDLVLFDGVDAGPAELAGLLTMFAEVASIDATEPLALRAEVEKAQTKIAPGRVAEFRAEVGQPVALLARHVAAQRLARIALAAYERRDATGAWPAGIDGLSGLFSGESVPLDPYTGRPFAYERTADGVRIASAGRFDGDEEPDAEWLLEHRLVLRLR